MIDKDGYYFTELGNLLVVRFTGEDSVVIDYYDDISHTWKFIYLHVHLISLFNKTIEYEFLGDL